MFLVTSDVIVSKTIFVFWKESAISQKKAEINRNLKQLENWKTYLFNIWL